MQFVRAYFRTLGRFWGIAILTAVSAVLVIVGLTLGGFLFASHVVAPLSKNLQIQSQNNAYKVQQASLAYQDTFTQEADQSYQQLRADMYNTAQAAQQGDQTMVTEGNAAIASDIHAFCGYAQKLTPQSIAVLGPNEQEFYQAHC